MMHGKKKSNNSSVDGLQHSGNHTCHLMYVNL